MNIEGAIIKEQGVTFAIVIVKSHIINSSDQCHDARVGFRRYFPEMPIILMAQDHNGRPTYQGRKDIVAFLANVDPARIPWKRYTID
ncbi:MAG: hypothetical protein ACHQHN_17130 [Sphingobacteriales bacterium]